jgi:hypothetical protein
MGGEGGDGAGGEEGVEGVGVVVAVAEDIILMIEGRDILSVVVATAVVAGTREEMDRHHDKTIVGKNPVINEM